MHSFFKLGFCIILCIITLPSYLAQHRNTGLIRCDQLPIQTQLDIKKLMGYWYVVEIVEHYTPRNPYVDTCIKVELKTIDRIYHHINLIWSEKDYTVTYTFDSSNQSYWVSQGHQIQKPDVLTYKQFAGTVSVLKAVHDNVVLTFCSPHNIFYSLVLSNSSAINQSELDIIHGIFKRYNIPISEKRKYCKSFANAIYTNNLHFFVILSTIFAFVLSNIIE